MINAPMTLPEESRSGDMRQRFGEPFSHWE
jgi:hypothetical protein